MDPLLSAGLISALGSLFSGYLNNQSIQATNEINRMYNDQIIEKNLKNQWDMWKATNQYNTPLEQMKRYKAAGLNPNLIYGQSNTTSPMNVGTASSIQSLPKNFDFLASALPDMISALQQTQSVKKGKSEIDILATENLIKQMEYGYLSEHYDNLLDLDTWQIKKLQKEVDHVNKLVEIGDLDKAIKVLEKTSKEFNVKYEESQFNAGIIPDLDPQLKLIVNMIGNLFSFLSHGKINKDDFIKSIIGFEIPEHS